VLNGDVVRIRARGAVCPGTWYSEECAGPEGFAHVEGWLRYNRPEFRGLPHASLVGLYAGEPVVVGEGTEFVVERPGLLLLGVNDVDPGNNSGGFEVVVEINPPARPR
jgi:hypothetical protein